MRSHTMPRYSLRELFLWTLLVALALAAYRMFWDNQPTSAYSPLSNNAHLIFGFNLALLTTVSVGIYVGRPYYRRYLLGYSAFGWAYLICALHASFGFLEEIQLWLLARRSLLGIALSVVCGLSAQCLFPAPLLPKGRKEDIGKAAS